MAKKTKSNQIIGVSPAKERDWQAEGDTDTLMRAIEIRRDPKRLKKAIAIAKERLSQAQAVTKAVAKEPPEKKK